MNTLDSFEEELLGHLRTVVADRHDLAPAKRRRPAVKLAAAGAVTTAAVGAALLGDGQAPAFAVTDQPNGDVRVQVEQLADAAALQQALADHGVPATVRYVGEDLSGDSPAARRAAFDPTSLPEGTTRYTMADCGASAVGA